MYAMNQSKRPGGRGNRGAFALALAAVLGAQATSAASADRWRNRRPGAAQPTRATAPRPSKGDAPAVLYTTRVILDARSFSSGRGQLELNPIGFKALRKSVQYLEQHPRDVYMLQHALSLIKTASSASVRNIVDRFLRQPTAVIASLLYNTPADRFPFVEQALRQCTHKLGTEPMVQFFRDAADLRTRSMLRRGYASTGEELKRIFRKNKELHVPLEALGVKAVPIPADSLTGLEQRGATPVSAFAGRRAKARNDTHTSIRDTRVETTVERGLEILEQIIGEEPNLVGHGYAGTYMMLVAWSLDLRVNVDRADMRLLGNVQSSGKGVDHGQTVASAIMETVERWSAGAGATPNWPHGYENELRLQRSRLSRLRKGKVEALDPNRLSLPIPYQDEEIYWVSAVEKTKGQDRQLHVPAQAVFFPINLDEQQIMQDTTNGLASGNTSNEARLHALLEIIERDGDHTVFYHPDRVFQLAKANGHVGEILTRLEGKGVPHVQFLDLTTELGIPTYRAFVKVGDQLLSGSGAHLDGTIALTRALCELTPKLFVHSRSQGRLRGVVSEAVSKLVKPLSSIPDYSSGDVKADLTITEKTVIANGYNPIYVDLTRSDIQIPVVRAIVPGLDLPQGLSRRQIHRFLSEWNPALLDSSQMPSGAGPRSGL